MDLTPYYGFEEDARHFHATCKRALEAAGSGEHARFKRWCDEYFYLKHRAEPRGIGGIFFDDHCTPDFAGAFALTRSVGDRFLDAREAGRGIGGRIDGLGLRRRGCVVHGVV